MNRKYTITVIIALLAVLAVSAAVILHWLRNITEDEIAGAVMEASDMDAGGVALNSSFILTFDSPVSSAAVRRCLSVEPEIEVGVHQGSSQQQVLVVPAVPLDEDTLYTFELSMDDAAAGWAFQTGADVHIASFTPEDRSTVHDGSSICFTLDRLLYADLDRIDDHFSIEPEIDGSFEQQGRTLVFTADKEFAPGTVYRVALKSGLPFSGSSAVLADSVEFAFEAGRPGSSWQLLGTDLYHSGEKPVFRIQSTDGSELPETIQMQLFSFEKDDYVDLLTDIAEHHPAWTEGFAALGDCSTDTGKLLISGNVEPGSSGEFSLPDAPQNGCYLLRVNLNGSSLDLPFMVSGLIAAVITHGDDVLLWLHDGKTGDSLKQTSVRDAVSGKTVASDTSGVALFKDVDDAVVCVVETDSADLVMPVWQCGSDADARWLWRYLYLSQDSYECGDELSFWGLAQPRDGSALEYDRVTVYLFDGDGEPVLQQYCPLDDSCFSSSIAVPQLPDGIYRLAIWQSGRELVGRDFALGEASVPDALIEEKDDETAVLLDSTYYDLGESFAASCSQDAEDYLFLMSDSDSLTWRSSQFGLYAGVFQPRDQLDSYCSALYYAGDSYTRCTGSPLYLDYTDRRLDIKVTKTADNAYSLTVCDDSGAPVAGASAAVSVCCGPETAVSPLDAIYTDYYGSGFPEEMQTADPGCSGSDKCLYFTVVSTDENGSAEFDLGQLTAPRECYLQVQAVYNGDRILAGAEQMSLDLPFSPAAEEEDVPADKWVSGFSELDADNAAFTGYGEDSLFIAAPLEQAHALALLGQALEDDFYLAAAAAADVLTDYSGSMMEELLSGCGYDLSGCQDEDGSVDGDIATSVLLALLQPDEISKHTLSKYFYRRLSSCEISDLSSCEMEDDYAACLAGLAALEHPHLNDVRSLLGRGDLSFDSRCWLAIASALCGDSRAGAIITGRPESAEEWALYGLALAYCGDYAASMEAMDHGAALGDDSSLDLYRTAAAALVLNDPNIHPHFRLPIYKKQDQQNIYSFGYSVDGTDYQKTFSGESKYQLPLKGFDGQLRIYDAGDAGFCCFSVSSTY